LAHGWGVIEYRPILGFPDYFISNEGTVISMRNGKFNVMKYDVSPKGYFRVKILKAEKESFGFHVHRLVLETFVGPCPDGMQTRHLDGNPSNNLVSNLAWGTALENCKDRIRHGNQFKIPPRRGEQNNTSKLTEQHVLTILTSPETGRALAAKMNVTDTAVSLVRTGKTWKHVSCPNRVN
jgi:hypothetical protein